MYRFHIATPLFDAAAGDPAGGGGAPPAFDPAAFQTSLMAEVTKTIGNALKAFKPAPAAAASAADPIVDSPAGDPKPGAKDPQFAALERQNKTLLERFAALETENKNTRSQAEEKERHAAIRSSLGDLAFASDDARDDAFRAFREEVKRGEDGELYGGDMVPLKDYVKTRMGSKAHLLAPKAVDSAGARQNAGMVGGRQVQFEDIKPGMDAKTREASWAAIRAQMGH